MTFGVFSIASSSSGNSYFVGNEDIKILVDAGVSNKKIKENLALKGFDIADLDAMLITHEHSDHIKCLKAIARQAKKAIVILSEGTLKGIKERDADTYIELLTLSQMGRVKTVTSGEKIAIGDALITAFDLSHDTYEPISYAIKYFDKKISIVTDTGRLTDSAFSETWDSDVLILESNHEPEILLYGSYPYIIKQRILSDVGHLSNESCAKEIIRMIEKRKAAGLRPMKVFLAHLSTENNTPSQAIITSQNLIEEAGYLVGKDVDVETLKKDEASRWIIA